MARKRACESPVAAQRLDNGPPRNIQRKHGVKVTQVASRPPSVPAIIGGSVPGSRNAAMKPTNCSTMISGPGVVSAMPSPSSISRA